MFMANRALASLGSDTKWRPEQISALIKLERTKAFLFYSILLYRGARALVLRPRRGPSLGARGLEIDPQKTPFQFIFSLRGPFLGKGPPLEPGRVLLKTLEILGVGPP